MRKLCAMKNNYLRLGLCFFLLNASTNLFAQERDSTIFLGDTLSITQSDYVKLNSDAKNLFKPLNSKDSKYLANGVGKFTLQNRQYHILDPLKDGVTKVLVIGNSFSDDGVESYLYDMAGSTGKALVIGNLFRGGAPLDFHLKNATTNNKIYSYRKTTIDGIKSNTNKTSILEALKDENWDYICFQQASVTSGNWATIEESLPQLYEYVAENYPISTVKYLYHQTWAYAQNSTTGNFDKYDRDQNKMFEQIVSVSERIGDLIPLYKVVPSGTAIQNGRTTYLGDNFTREGYHLDLAFGRYTAASTWYQTLFSDIDNVNYKPNHLSIEQVSLAKEAADLAVRNPFAVTKMNNYQIQKTNYIEFEQVKVNLGSDIIIPGWLSLLFEQEGSGRFGVLDQNNKPTSVNVRVLKSFESRKANGPKLTSYHSEVPTAVSQFYFRANVDRTNEKLPFIQLENLDPAKEYELTFISAVQEDQNNTVFHVIGDKIKSAEVNPSFNRNKDVSIQNIKPKIDGTIAIGFSLPKGKEQSTAILNGMIIQQKK